MRKKIILQLLTYIGLLILLRNPINDFINKIMAEPVVSKIETIIWTDLSLIALIIIALLLSVRQKDHQLFIRWGMLLLIPLLLFRWDTTWTYTPMYLWGAITYVDLIGVGVFLSFSWHLVKRYLQKDSKELPNVPSKSFIEDNEVDSTETDTFERTVVANKIGEFILNTNNQKSFAIGITGKYGSGKTSFINLILKTWEQEKVNRPMIMCYNPWDSQSSDDIQKNFFDELVGRLSGEERRLSSLIYHYYRRLSNQDTWLSRLANNLHNVFLFSAHGLYNDKKEIGEMMKNLNRKMVIVIDDLDRLHADEVIEVLRIVRNTANFPNIMYLVAFDKEYVQHAIKKVNEETYNTYLDKIFQIEIPLPKFEQNLIADSLLEKMRDFIEEDETKILEDKIIPLHFNSDYDDSIAPAFRNQRDVVRFINNFKLTYSLISKEVNFLDLFFLEILKVRYPIAYDLLYMQRDEIFIKEAYSGLFRARYFLRKKEGKEDTFLFMEKFSSKYTPDEIEIIKRILIQMFKTHKLQLHRDRERSINNLEYFDTYFASRISAHGFSEHEFKLFYLESESNHHEYIEKNFSRGNHTKFVDRILSLELTEYKDRSQYELIVRELTLSIGPKYLEEEDSRSFPFDRFIARHIKPSNEIIRRFYKNDKPSYTEFVNSIFSFNRIGHYFLSELAKRIVELYGNSYFLSMQRLVEYQTSYFKEYAESGHGLSRKVVWMFWGIHEYDETDLDPKTGRVRNPGNWRFNAQAIDILKRQLNKVELKYFLESLIRREEPHEKEYKLDDKLIPALFENIEEPKQVVRSNQTTSDEVKDEFLDFSEKLLNQNSVEYKFKYLFNETEVDS